MSNDEILARIEELSIDIKRLSDKQDSQFTELMMKLQGPSISTKNLFDEDEDPAVYELAKKFVIESGKASTSYLQRRMGIGYARAARLIDMLEEEEVIGPGSGAKPREVLKH